MSHAVLQCPPISPPLPPNRDRRRGGRAGVGGGCPAAQVSPLRGRGSGPPGGGLSLFCTLGPVSHAGLWLYKIREARFLSSRKSWVPWG